MVKCENCSFEKGGAGPVLCPKCGYIMHEVKAKIAKPNRKLDRTDTEENLKWQ